MVRKLSRICAVLVVLAALLLSAPSAYAGPQAFQRSDGSSWDLGSWIDSLRLWLQETLAKGQDKPETRLEVASAGLGGPTGPCIDPQGGRDSSSFCEE